MMVSPFPDVARIRNNLGADRCLQFAFMAAIETLGCDPISVDEADVATGFQPGGTWPFTMLSWFAANGFDVRHIENTNFRRFVDDPAEELRSQGLSDELIALFFEISDFDAEGLALQRAIDSPDVELISRLPELSDITEGIGGGWLPLISLDASTLVDNGSDEFDGHMVLGTAVGDGLIRIQDPGPPMHWDWDVRESVVLSSMRKPTESSGTLTLVRRKGI